MSLIRFDRDGLELVIDTDTGESFATISGYARMSGKAKSTIAERVEKVESSGQSTLKSAEIQTQQGLRTVRLLNEDLISEWIVKDHPDLATKMLKAGVRVFLHTAAGYKLKAVSRFAKVEEEESDRQIQPLSDIDALDIAVDRLKKNLMVYLSYLKVSNGMGHAMAMLPKLVDLVCTISDLVGAVKDAQDAIKAVKTRRRALAPATLDQGMFRLSQIAQELGCSTRSLARYRAIAKDCVPEYCDGSDVPGDSNAILSKGQYEIVAEIKTLFDQVRFTPIVKKILADRYGK